MGTVEVSSGIPRLRPELVVMPDGETGRGRVVKDPRTRRYFRFDELEGFILDRLDGSYTAVDIQIALASDLGEEFSLEELQDFIDTLKEKGLCDDDRPTMPVHAPGLGAEVATALAAQGIVLPPVALDRTGTATDAQAKLAEAVGFLREGRFSAALRSFDELLAAHPGHTQAATLRALLVQVGGAAALAAAQKAEAASKKGSALYRRVPLFDPDALYGRLAPLCAPIWTRGFVAVYAAYVLLAGFVFATHRAELFSSLPHLPGYAFLAAIAVASLVHVALHETAHGLTCKHFGGRVPEAGFLLIFFFMPAFYVDVTDAWVFRQRRQRVLVSLAGPLLDLFVASTAILAWRVLAPGYGRMVAIAVMTAAATNVLLNLNPLMKLDGYYVLSDISGIPNLREAATRAMGRMFRFGSNHATGEAPMPARTLALLAVYGLLTTLYSGFILYVLGKALFLISSKIAGLWGPLLLLAGLGWLLRRMIGRLVAAIARFCTGFTIARAATVSAAACAALALFVLPLSLKVTGPAALEARVRGAVRPPVGGNLAEVLVKEGDRVEAGQVVARIDSRDLEAHLGMARAAIARAQAELRLVSRGPEREVLAQARERVHAARAQVEQLRSRHERLTRLRAEGLVAPEQFDQSKTELVVGEGALRATAEETRLVEKGARPEEIAAAQAEVQRLEAEAVEVQRRIEGCTLRAPAAGIVITPNLDQRRGDFVSAGGVVLEIADTATLAANVVVLESEIGDVAPGRTVQLRFAAFPDRTFEGTVEDVAPAARPDQLGRAVFNVRCRVHAAATTLRPGMTGAAKIACGTRTVAQLIARRVMRMIDPSLL